jgi:hypothetical protein
MYLHLKIIGTIFVALALFHLIFPKYFKWKEDLQPLSLINRQMMSIHTLFIGLIIFLMGVLCLTSTDDMIQTGLGKRIALGFAIFWSVRLIVQFFGFSSKLWKGKTLETTAHFLLTGLWTYSSLIFWMIALGLRGFTII